LSGSTVHSTAVIQCLQSAVALYRGPFLEGFTLDDSPAFEEWVLNRREHHMQQVLQAFKFWRPGTKTPVNMTWQKHTLAASLSLEPWREPAHQQLMRLLALQGQRVAALAQFEQLKKVLEAELGVEPSPESHQLYELVRANKLTPEGHLETHIHEPIPSPEPRHNLPVRLSSFIGREKEMAQVRDLIAQHRLVTLTGAGGVGKTSLAVQVAGAMLESFPDGVFLVELGLLSDPELLSQACTRVLGIVDEPGQNQVARLEQYLVNKQLLLLLDNCEHLITACASLTQVLMKGCPRLHILATSREALGLVGEYVWQVPTLSTPDLDHLPGAEEVMNFEAVALFIERMAEVHSGLNLSTKNIRNIVQVCSRLDGIPLAIELAAARARLLSLDQIAARLDDAFRLLAGGNRAALERHQTLHACIDWSYNLLSPKERLLFQRISVFAGGLTLEAAEAVCADDGRLGGVEEQIDTQDVMDLLTGLVDKSLVIARHVPHGHRYHMLTTICQYAGERLHETGCSPAIHNRHLDYFARLVRQAEPELRGKDQVEWMDILEEELENLRAAMEWSIHGQIEVGLEMAANLVWFWWVRNFFQEGNQWLEKLLAVEETQPHGDFPEKALQRARALRARCQLSIFFEPMSQEQRTKYLDESVEILRSLGQPARHELGIVLQLFFHRLGQSPVRLQNIEDEMLEILRQEGDSFYLSEYLFGKFGLALDQGNYAQARVYIDESLRLCEELGDLDGISSRKGELSLLLTYSGEYEHAASLIQDAIQISQKNRNQAQGIYYQIQLVRIHLAQGNYAEAIRLGESAFAWSKEFNQRFSINMCYTILLQTYWASGDFARVDELAQEAIQAYHIEPIHPAWEPHHYIARAALTRGDTRQAQKYMQQAFYYSPTKEVIVPGCAILFAQQGKYERAAIIFAAVDFLIRQQWSGLTPRERSEHEDALSATRRRVGGGCLCCRLG
jgi:predicted ATPase